MRILVITKRQYTKHDLIDDRFGRLREIPLALARRGHQVQGTCLSYQHRQEVETVDTDESGLAQVNWQSFNAGRLKLNGLTRYIKRVKELTRKFKPDVIWACSDSFYGIIGTWLARQLRTHCVFDLYDNFESFASTYIPGVRPLYRRAIRTASGVTCVSSTLMDLISEGYGRTKPTLMLVNGIRKDLFYSRDKKECRRELGLPEDARIIGTAGALYGNRGINALFKGFEQLAAEDQSIHLAVAGPRDKRARLPAGPRVHDLGLLPLEKVPFLFNALDVAVVCNRDSSFGRYCFPQKAYEIMACRVPLIASAVGTMKALLSRHDQYLFIPECADDLARAAKAQITAPFIYDGEIPTWDNLAETFERFFQEILRKDNLSSP